MPVTPATASPVHHPFCCCCLSLSLRIVFSPASGCNYEWWPIIFSRSRPVLHNGFKREPVSFPFFPTPSLSSLFASFFFQGTSFFYFTLIFRIGGFFFSFCSTTAKRHLKNERNEKGELTNADHRWRWIQEDADKWADLIFRICGFFFSFCTV